MSVYLQTPITTLIKQWKRTFVFNPMSRGTALRRVGGHLKTVT